jgi:hypothetical protein
MMAHSTNSSNSLRILRISSEKGPKAMSSQKTSHLLLGTLFTAVLLGMVFGVPSVAQNPQSKKQTPKKQSAAQPKKEAPKPPISQAEVQRLWAQGDDDLAMNELTHRGLDFEPEEDWLAQLPKTTTVEPSRVPRFSAELRKRIPPAPSVDAVAAAAPALLDKLKEAAQKRSETDMESLVHPALLQNKGKIYTLFDTANYRAHSLGRFSPQPNRRVGVQFFQLTTSQVETLHYVLFSTSHDKIVVRDVITGPDVAALFLQDEQQVALNKLNLMFRALNDGDDSGLKNLCTPGLYEDLRNMAPDTKAVGTFLTRGQVRNVDANSVKASVPLDQKSIRVVVRIGYVTKTGKQVQFDVDFERIDNDLKVVRLRDTDNKIIAWDPNIDNYLNRRYGLPDTAPPEPDRSVIFVPLGKIQNYAESALDSRNAAKLKDYAEQLLEEDPSGGDGFGLRASAEFILGAYDDAEKDAGLALERGGTVYFYVLRHFMRLGSDFDPVVLGISRQKIDYRPPAGQSGGATEEIPIASIEKVAFDKRGLGGLKQPEPFLKLDFRSATAKQKQEYKLAAFGTSSVGAEPGRSSLSLPNVLASASYNTPRDWERNLVVVQKTIMAAAAAGQQPKKR